MLIQGHPSVTLRLLTTFYKTHGTHYYYPRSKRGERSCKALCRDRTLTCFFLLLTLLFVLGVHFLIFQRYGHMDIIFEFFLNDLRM